MKKQLVVGIFMAVWLQTFFAADFAVGKWVQPDGKVFKKFDTDMGAVYDFPRQEIRDVLPSSKDGKRTYDFSSLQVDMLDNGRRWKSLLRYIVLEFEVRLFPANSKGRIARLHFTLTRSALSPKQIKNTGQLAAFLDFPYQHACVQLWTTLQEQKVDSRCIMSAAQSYYPAFRANRVRLIFDTGKNGSASINVNGQKDIRYVNDKAANVRSLRSIGIFINDYDDDDSKDIRRVMEISPPLIFMTDNPEELKQLPQVTIPGDLYETGRIAADSRRKNSRNPDEVYAAALANLKGEDLVEGVDQLEKAIQSGHVLALYQLGFCYLDGIGVEHDEAKALALFDQAAQNGVPEAAGQYLLSYLQMTRPSNWQGRKKTRMGESLKQISILSRTPELMLAEMSVGIGRGALTISPKMCFARERFDWNVGTGKPDIADCFKSCLDQNYVPALLFAGRELTRANRFREAFELFEQAAEQGDRAARLEGWLALMQRNMLPKGIFCEKNDLEYGDQPLYVILKYVAANPEAPGNAALLVGDWTRAGEKWRRGSLDEERLLGVLEELYRFFYAGFDAYMWRNIDKEMAEMESAWKTLDEIAETGLAEAQYWAGIRRLDFDRKLVPAEDSVSDRAGIRYLTLAAEQGHIAAQFRLLQMRQDNREEFFAQHLADLNRLCESGSSRTLLFKGEVYFGRAGKNATKSANAVTAFETFELAAKSGAMRGLYYTGLCRYKGIGVDKDKKGATKDWLTYMNAERQSRQQDFFDTLQTPKAVETVFNDHLHNSPQENRVITHQEGIDQAIINRYATF